MKRMQENNELRKEVKEYRDKFDKKVQAATSAANEEMAKLRTALMREAGIGDNLP